jgi:Tfp pilus assembly protein PilX
MGPPPPAATVAPTGRLRGASAQPSRPGEASRLRRTLHIVPSRGQRGRRAPDQRARKRGRILNIISISLVVAALLAVVVAQALLANGQVRLSALQDELSLEQSAHRQAELSVSELETPARIVGAATSQLHMVRPATVTELPYVSLNTPLATPNVTPAAGTSTPSTTATTAP